MTDAERRAALESIAAEVRTCTRCRLHEGRTRAVPGEGNSATEVMFVGEGPGLNEDRLGRPFVGRAGDLLVRLLGSIGWRRDEVFITNVVKCRPPDNRDPQPDEIAACEPFLRRQLEALDPALVVTLGRHSMGRFMPGARISQAHGTLRPAAAETGAGEAMVFAMYHPAAALRTPAIERTSFDDIAAVPAALLEARRRRSERAGVATEIATAGRDRASGPAVADAGAAGSAGPANIAAVATAPVPVGSAALPASLSSPEILGQADETASSAGSGRRIPLAADVSGRHLAAGTMTVAVGPGESGWSHHPADTRVVVRRPAGESSPEAEPSPAAQATGLGEPSPVGEPTAAEPQPAAEGRPAPDPTADSSDQLSLF